MSIRLVTYGAGNTIEKGSKDVSILRHLNEPESMVLGGISAGSW